MVARTGQALGRKVMNPHAGPRSVLRTSAALERQLTRAEFYKLAHECRDYALRLATHDQDLVSWELCQEFNRFRQRVRSYDRLRTPLAEMRPARPITRGMAMATVVTLWLVLAVVAGRVVGRYGFLLLASVVSSLVLLVLLIPPRVYGTSVDAIEGRVLMVVEALQHILESQEMEFSEAAYFVVRDVLREAADELRQQVYLSRVAARR